MHELAFVLENPSDVVTPQTPLEVLLPKFPNLACLIWEYGWFDSGTIELQHLDTRCISFPIRIAPAPTLCVYTKTNDAGF